MDNTAALLVELTVTKSRSQFERVLDALRAKGWEILATPRDGEFGIARAAHPQLEEVTA